MVEQDEIIGRFRFQPGRCLLDNGEPVDIGAKALDILSALVAAEGRPVTKDQLMAAVWPGVVVEENAIHVHVSALRKVLGAEGRRIVTVRGLGYRYIAPSAETPETAAAPDRAPGNLPAQVGALIGRAAELAELRMLLHRHRLVTLAGTGGIGKSRLALQLGAELEDPFPDGVWFVALEHLGSPELVAEAIAGALQLSLLDDRSAAGSVVAFLKGKRLLLILDNAEHLIAEVARVAAAILAGAATVTLLVTSREVLGIPDEQVFRVPGLGVPATSEGLTIDAASQFSAIRLFAERAEAAIGTFVLTAASTPCIAEICRQLDGIPLAIELAATRMKLLAPEELLAGLADRFRILGKGSRVALARHQTLRAAFDWSHGLLSPAEQALFRRLSVFGGSFTVEAAAAIAVGGPIDPDAVLDLLGALVDKSLLVPVRGGEGHRLRLLESTRAYAAEQLVGSGETGWRRRLVEYLIPHFADADERYQTTPSLAWLARYEPDLESLRTGLAWAFGPDGDTALAIELVSYTREYWHELSLIPERRRWFAMAAELIDATTPRSIAARIHSGLCDGDFGDPRDRERALAAVNLLRGTGDTLRLAFALLQVAVSLIQPGEVAQAEPYFQESLALLRPRGRTKFLTFVLTPMGVSRVFAGDLAGARALMEESLAVARATGFGLQIELLQGNLAQIAFIAGDTEEAIRRARENQASCRQSGNLRILATTSQGLAGYLLDAADARGARESACEALRLHLALGRHGRALGCIEALALAAAMEGDAPRAARLAGYSAAQYLAAAKSREPVEQKCWTSLQALLRSALADHELEHLMAEGAAMDTDEAAAAALAD